MADANDKRRGLDSVNLPKPDFSDLLTKREREGKIKAAPSVKFGYVVEGGKLRTGYIRKRKSNG